MPALRSASRALAGAMVGPVYALPIVVITSLVRLQLPAGGDFVPEYGSSSAGCVWQAFVFPALLGIAAGGCRRGHGLARSPDARAHAWLVGGWRAAARPRSGSAAVGVLVLAAVRPQGLATYTRVVSSNGPRPPLLLLGHHALVLPNQSFFVLGALDGRMHVALGTWRDDPVALPGPAADPRVARPVLDGARACDERRSAGRRTIADRPMPPATGRSCWSPRSRRVAAGRYAGRTWRGRLRLTRGARAGRRAPA